MSGLPIEYKIVRMKRKSISLHLLKDGTLEVRAPHRITEKVLSEFVESKKLWIKKAKDRQMHAVILPTYENHEIEAMRAATRVRTEAFLEAFDGKKPEKINIRKQKTVWGTCNRKKTISINVFCGLLPESLFEYIMVHELCHLVELNHSVRFWNLVASYLPDWKQRRAELRKIHIGE